jgi:hypothetical protein
MSEFHDPSSSPPPPERPPLTVIPVPQFQQPPPPPPRGGTSVLGSIFRGFFVMAFLGMFGLVVFLVFLLLIRVGDDGGSGSIYERYHSGDKKATDKIAIVRWKA